MADLIQPRPTCAALPGEPRPSCVSLGRSVTRMPPPRCSRRSSGTAMFVGSGGSLTTDSPATKWRSGRRGPAMAKSGDDWALYADHRAHFTEGLLSCARQLGGRLCLLGAGQCNDVDLERLAEAFSEIPLVGICSAALAPAVTRPPPSVRARLHRHAPIDLPRLSQR